MQSHYQDRDIKEEEYAVLRCFYPEAVDVLLKDIQKRSGYSYERVYFYVKSLVKKKVVQEKKMGKTLVYSVNLTKKGAQTAYTLYATLKAQELAHRYPMLDNALQKLPEDKIDLVIVFGSYSRGTERKGKSDIDVMIVTSSSQEIESAIRSIKATYPLDIQSITLSRTEFGKIKQENKELWAELVTHGRIFKGQELFYYYAYKR